ncbi:hypothetical protein HPB51_028486 [Rhipicephalus microplus]|uniref:Uncharacterized protein n=1 Tax=Rhipicephalus microplus TaxID=6941 RepID=A0A9J6CX68_RHIMP|nr:hypothetical protein HPB51_028486 [Rhipicephalus microplus]
MTRTFWNLPRKVFNRAAETKEQEKTEVKKVTTSNHVKNFKPENSSDFEVKRLYCVYWEGHSRTAGAYYDAEILHMTGLDSAAFPGQLLCTEAAPAEHQLPQHSRPHPPLAEAEPSEPKSLQNSTPLPPAVETPPAFTLLGNGVVYLAHSVTVTKEVYETPMAVPKDSHFIKLAATEIRSSEVLAQRSFSWTLSNSYLMDGSEKAPQRPLTPRKVDTLKGKQSFFLFTVFLF